ncbi:lysophospholipase L1-like esterase [Murinocardiopsis flavida]|uniref:Lysophospholipase L1-like esterase n=1 Tax=Murinocardiopsis flavida TaxID=645275 RepID=A0A2P8CQW1_9ACTN|nr:SGNH/GDSL hydrolase family protein [Murinocardiopsis flavida]PSK87351.1 lysophospholipase L1-like esterase [Murinocardiopsis flavida]
MVLRAARASRIATATAFGGGGLTVLGASTVALLYLQAKIAHKAVGFTEWQPPRVNGRYGSGDGDPIQFVMMGDSTAKGFAVPDPLLTPGALLATGLSAAADRPVRLRDVAVIGATSKDLHKQTVKVRRLPPDLVVVFIGANDVIHRMRPADSVRHLQHTVRELVQMGAEVVVATCPDLGSVQPVWQPLRFLVRRWSRQLAAAQTIGVVEEGGRTVSLTDLLADEFVAHPDVMFGPDRFHPSARGYAAAASVVLPSAFSALGLLPELADLPEPSRGGAVLPVSHAAVRAAEKPGTEVTGVSIGGRERGPRGRWAALLRRRPESEEPVAPVAEEDAGPEGGDQRTADLGSTG